MTRRVGASAALTVTFVAMSSGAAWAQDDASVAILCFLIIAAILFAIFFIPTFVAFGRGHPNRWAILVINMVFGATGLGWFGSLIWALHAVHRSDGGSHGGETGLNLFVNDGQRIALPNRIEILFEALGRLKELLDRGAIDRDEYERLKQRLIKSRDEATAPQSQV